jgi:hypothetical protein
MALYFTRDTNRGYLSLFGRIALSCDFCPALFSSLLFSRLCFLLLLALSRFKVTSSVIQNRDDASPASVVKEVGLSRARRADQHLFSKFQTTADLV